MDSIILPACHLRLDRTPPSSDIMYLLHQRAQQPTARTTNPPTRAILACLTKRADIVHTLWLLESRIDLRGNLETNDLQNLSEGSQCRSLRLPPLELVLTSAHQLRRYRNDQLKSSSSLCMCNTRCLTRPWRCSRKPSSALPTEASALSLSQSGMLVERL